MQNLKAQALSGLVWTFLNQFGVQALNFIFSILLARILMPADFGIIGMFTILVAIGNALILGGMTESLLRKDDIGEEDYSSVFYTNLLVSVLVYVIVFVLAPFVADFFDQQILTSIIRVYCIGFIVLAFSAVQSAKLTKELKFKTKMLITVPSLIISGICGVAFAYSGFGVWTLVYMYLIQSTVATTQLWFRSKWRPSLRFSRKSFTRHFNFGFPLALNGILTAMFNNIFHVVIGRFFSPVMLGYYTRANSLKELPVSNITVALNKVSFPLFAKMENDPEKLQRAYRMMLQQIVFWLAPVLFFISIVAKPLITFLITEKWLPAVPFFQVLCIAALFFAIATFNLNILKIKGKTRTVLRLEFVKNMIILCGVLIFWRFGIYGLLGLQVGVSVLTFAAYSAYCGKLIGYSYRLQLDDLLPVFMLSLVSSAICYLSYKMLLRANITDVLLFGCPLLIAFAFYLGLSFVFKLKAFTTFIGIIRSKPRKL